MLLKQQMLIKAGWPRSALLVTVVRDKKGDGHAVLTVKTDKGEFILDNQNESVVLWSESGYRFVKRQSQVNPNAWVALGDPPRQHHGQRALIKQRRFAVRSRPHPSPSQTGSRAAGLPQRPAAFFCGACKWPETSRLRPAVADQLNRSA